MFSLSKILEEKFWEKRPGHATSPTGEEWPKDKFAFFPRQTPE